MPRQNILAALAQKNPRATKTLPDIAAAESVAPGVTRFGHIAESLMDSYAPKEEIKNNLQGVYPNAVNSGTKWNEIMDALQYGVRPSQMPNHDESRFNDGSSYQVAQASEPFPQMKLTGDQSKTAIYHRRGLGANQTLNDPKMAESLTQFTDTFAGKFGGVGRLFQDADYQVAKRAADEFLAAILRKDTGAAITSQEFDLYGPMYLPMPGDKPELLDAKKEARKQAIIALEMGLGSAAPLAERNRSDLVKDDLTDEDFLKQLGL